MKSLFKISFFIVYLTNNIWGQTAIIDTIITPEKLYSLKKIDKKEYNSNSSYEPYSIKYPVSNIVGNKEEFPKNKKFEVTKNVKICKDSMVIRTNQITHIFHNKEEGSGTHKFHYIDYLDFANSYLIELQGYDNELTILVNANHGDMLTITPQFLNFYPKDNLMLGVSYDYFGEKNEVHFYYWDDSYQIFHELFMCVLPEGFWLENFFMNNIHEIFIKAKYNENNSENDYVYCKIVQIN